MDFYIDGKRIKGVRNFTVEKSETQADEQYDIPADIMQRIPRSFSGTMRVAIGALDLALSDEEITADARNMSSN